MYSKHFPSCTISPVQENPILSKRTVNKDQEISCLFQLFHEHKVIPLVNIIPLGLQILLADWNSITCKHRAEFPIRCNLRSRYHISRLIKNNFHMKMKPHHPDYRSQLIHTEPKFIALHASILTWGGKRKVWLGSERRKTGRGLLLSPEQRVLANILG